MLALNIIALSASGNRLEITSAGYITGGSKNVDICLFTFDGEWADFTKIAVFSTAEGDEYTEIIRNNRCVIPEQCLKKNGILRIGVIGTDNGTKILSTNFAAHRITRGANENGAVRYSKETFSEAGSNLDYNPIADESVSLDSHTDDFEIDEASALDELCSVYKGYAQNVTAENNFEYYEFKNAGFKKTVVLKCSSDFTRSAAAEFFAGLCTESGTNTAAGRLFNSVRFIVFSAENYESFFSNSDISNIVFAAEIDTLQISPLSKAVIFTKTSSEKSLVRAAEKFDALNSEPGTIFLKKNREGFADYMSDRFGVNSCSVVWNSENEEERTLADFLKSIIVSQSRAEKYPGTAKANSFTKHICWRSSAADDTFALEEQIKTMWLSLYKTNLNGFYDISLSGYALVRSQTGGVVTIRPVVYQENIDKQCRFADTSFDTECTLNQGITSVAFSGIIYGNYSVNKNAGSMFPGELGTVLRAKVAQGDAEIIGFSYTLTAVASNGNQTEILVPQGLVADYLSEETPPVFMVKNFSDAGEEIE